MRSTSTGSRRRNCRAVAAVSACLLALAAGEAGSAAADPAFPAADAYTTNGPVWAIARAGGQTFVGGDFTRVGRRSGTGAVISTADGSRQSFPEVAGGAVQAAVSDGVGGWYIGGSFTAVGGESHVGLAHVLPGGGVDSNFTATVTNAEGRPAPVYALAYARTGLDVGKLYVGGAFARVGRPGAMQTHNNLAAVNGTDGGVVSSFSATALCSASPGANCTPAVRAVALTEVPLSANGATQLVPLLFVGGDFERLGPSDNPSDVPQLGAVWGVGALDENGKSKTGLLFAGSSPWRPASQVVVRALSVAPVQPAAATVTFPVYAGGDNLATPSSGYLTAYQISMVANTRTTSQATFDNWTPNPDCAAPGCSASVRAMTASASKLYLAGDFTRVLSGTTQVSAPRVAQIDLVPDPTKTSGTPATTARPFGGGVDGTARAVALSPDGSRLVVGGDFTKPMAAADDSAGRLAAFSLDGTSTGWAPAPDGATAALATDPSAPSAVYAGGSFSSLGSVAREGLAAFDSGGGLLDWHPGVESSDPVARPARVRALAASDATVYVGGTFDRIRGNGGATQDRLDLAAIDMAGEPTGFRADAARAGAAPQVEALALLDSTLYVGGAFDHLAGQPRGNGAAVDATSGQPSGWDPAADDALRAIVPACGAVYVGGDFLHAGGQARQHIAALAPDSGGALDWAPNADGAVLALARSGPTLYAGGTFAHVGGQLRQKVAGLDVSDGTPTAFDANADGTVDAIAVTDSGVYAGGRFDRIGGADRLNLAAMDAGSGQATGWNPAAAATVRALIAGGDALFAGGSFASIDAAEQQGIAPFMSGAGEPPSPASSCSPPPALATGEGSPAGASAPSGSATTTRAGVRIPPRTASPLSVTPTLLRIARDRLTVRFTLARPGRVRLRFERQVRVRCPRSSGATRRCLRYVLFVDVVLRGKRGSNRVTFRRGRVGSRRLAPGRYRVGLTPLPARGARVQRAYFTAVSR